MNPPHPPRKVLWPYLLIASLTAISVTLTTAAWWLFSAAPEPFTAPSAVDEQLVAQIEAVRKGEAEQIELNKTLITDEELVQFRGLENLKVLILDAGIITDAGMKEIAMLTNLNHLRLRHSPITDLGIQELTNLKELKFLNLPQAKLTAKGVESLAGLAGLRQLRLGGDDATDLSTAVSQLKGLRAVHLIDIPVSDSGLRLLAAMPALESLYLDNARINEQAWEWLFENHPELHVHINQRHHDRDPNRHAH